MLLLLLLLHPLITLDRLKIPLSQVLAGVVADSKVYFGVILVLTAHAFLPWITGIISILLLTNSTEDVALVLVRSLLEAGVVRHLLHPHEVAWSIQVEPLIWLVRKTEVTSSSGCMVNLHRRLFNIAIVIVVVHLNII